MLNMEWKSYDSVSFVDLKDIIPDAIIDMKYSYHDNFTGVPVPGYKANKALFSKQAADALFNAAQQFLHKGYLIKVFDTYRPQKAVDFFVTWSSDLDDQKMKASHYPNINKSHFFELGYLARKSGHTRGSAVDLTLVDFKTGKELDMGTIFDFLDEKSHFPYQGFSREVLENRALLRSVMMDAGFEPYDKEWWHFRLKNEPYPTTYFDFDVI